jgi:predicted transposase YbfD/YdcC
LRRLIAVLLPVRYHPQQTSERLPQYWDERMHSSDDECRVRTNHAPANFTTIKHMAHNLLRKAPGKTSLRSRRKAAARDDDFPASLITG